MGIARKSIRRSDSSQFSLFPFLAVLICTMGVLIVLLVLVTKLADHRAEETRQAAAAETAQALELLQDDLAIETLRRDGLGKQRPKLVARLEEQRTLRQHFEAEVRELEKRLEQELAAVAAARRMAETPAAAGPPPTELAERLATLKRQLETETSQLEKLKQLAATQRDVYSIVPTSSVDGSRRKPIYIECTESGLWIRPFGVHLQTEDFVNHPTAGNPLDSSLMAIREKWNRVGLTAGDVQAYPLFVVRPGGAQAYALARRAMRHWDDQFGYELVEQDKELDFGSSDPELAAELNAVIEQSRVFQSRLARNSSARSGGLPIGSSDASGSSVGLRASPRGGFIAADGSRLRPSRIRQGTAGQSTPSLQPDSTSDTAGQAGRPATPATPATTASNSGRMASSATDDSNGARSSTSEAGRNSLADSQSVAGQATGQAASGDPNAGPSQPTEQSAAMAQTPNLPSLAESRGAGWALPTRTSGAVAYKRPVKIICRSNELEIRPAAQVRSTPLRIPVHSSRTAAEQLVSELWNTMDSWGIAGVGSYWQPELVVEIEDGGEANYQALLKLLDNSGLEIKKQGPDQ